MAFLVFALAQLLDGVFTYVGIGSFGREIEANPLMAWYIALLGAAAALISAKLIAVGCAAILHVRSMHGTVTALAVLYFVAALLPWAHIFWL